MTVQARHQGVLILLNLITTVSVSEYTMSLHRGEQIKAHCRISYFSPDNMMGQVLPI